MNHVRFAGATLAAVALATFAGCGGAEGSAGDPPSGGNGNSTGGAGTGTDPQPPGYVYVVDVGSNVYQLAVAADGSLGSPLTVAVAGFNPAGIVSDPSGQHVYVINGDGSISQYAVAAGGNLTPLSPATVASCVGPGTVDPTGHFLYVQCGAIAQYAIGSDGTLSPLNPAYASVTATFFNGPLVLDPSGQHAYIAAVNELLELDINDDGTVAAASEATLATSNAWSIALSADGQRAYGVNPCIECSGQLELYDVGATGLLTATASINMPPDLAVQQLLSVTSGAYALGNADIADSAQPAGLDIGAVTPYSISSAGLLTQSGTQLNLPFYAISEALFGANLYALGLHSDFSAGLLESRIVHYTLDAQGLPMSAEPAVTVGTTGTPVGMTFVQAH